MNDTPGPLGELAATLTGSAAGHYGAHHGDDVADTSETQAPLGRTADPLGRRTDHEVDEEDDVAPLVERAEDADGAPEL